MFADRRRHLEEFLGKYDISYDSICIAVVDILTADCWTILSIRRGLLCHDFESQARHYRKLGEYCI